MAKVFPDLAGGYSGKVGKSLYYRVKKRLFRQDAAGENDSADGTTKRAAVVV